MHVEKKRARKSKKIVDALKLQYRLSFNIEMHFHTQNRGIHQTLRERKREKSSNNNTKQNDIT